MRVTGLVGIVFLAFVACAAGAGDLPSEICGGIAHMACDDPGEFCKLGVGQCCCDFQGVCTAIPTACPEYYDPVCGCDGVTYSNECFADAAATSIDHLGPCGQICGGIQGLPCDDGELCLLPEGGCCCDFQGLCVPIPEECPETCDPVCGCDGQTYRNACQAIQAGSSIDHVGPCYVGGGLITGVAFHAPTGMDWDPHPSAQFYNVYRNVVASDPPVGAGVCFASGVVEPSVPVLSEPHPGVLWLFQVAGQYAEGEGPLGTGWTCEPRIPSAPCSAAAGRESR